MGQYRDNRIKLHNILKTFCENVYYEAPSSGMKYPCIKYKLVRPYINKADDINYKREDIYECILIHQDFVNDIVDKLIDLDHCSFKNHYIADDLHHFVYEIYI